MAKNKTRTFHERFEIEVGTAEAQRRFVNRIRNYVFGNVFKGSLDFEWRSEIAWQVANALGEQYEYSSVEYYVKGDYYRCLQALEVMYRALVGSGYQTEVTEMIRLALSSSETDLGIEWKPPKFVPTGARVLDDHLINEQLRWLSKPKYKAVYEPFEKGLSHFIESEKKPQLLPDVITDMYESVEALAKIVTDRPGKDLSGNAEMFISKIKASDHYKKLLKDYIAYANEFRHAQQEGKPRPTLSRAEAESFMYLTGLFIRLVMQRS